MGIPTPPRAVVFDLFGTLVDAPTGAERRDASRALAAVIPARATVIEQVFDDSWAERHDGRLPTVASLCAFLVRRCGGSVSDISTLRIALHRLAGRRLSSSPTVLVSLGALRDRHLRIALLSDASAEIAEAWQQCALAAFIDVAVFSCRAGAVKPDRRLYSKVLDQLAVSSRDALYCGDGGGDELRGATAAGLTAVRVERRGGPSSLAFGERSWDGPSVTSVEALPSLLFS